MYTQTPRLPATSTSEQPQMTVEALLQGPASPPPPGMHSNFHDPPNLNAAIYAAKALILTITTLAVGIRIYTRHVLLRSMGYDDYMSFLAWLGLLGFIGLSLAAAKAGAGVHMWDLRLGDFFELLRWANYVIIFFDPVNICVKVAILLQYSRIFNPIGRKDLPLFVAIQFIIWSITAFYTIEMFFNIFQCHPREKIWNPLITTGRCYSNEALLKASGVFNVIMDFAILILPLSSIWRLQMTLRKKVLISAVFAIGFLACLMSIMRTLAIWHIAMSTDTSRHLAHFGLWSDAEFAIGILVGCIPVTPRFFQHVGPKLSRALLSFPFTSPSSLSSTNVLGGRGRPRDQLPSSISFSSASSDNKRTTTMTATITTTTTTTMGRESSDTFAKIADAFAKYSYQGQGQGQDQRVNDTSCTPLQHHGQDDDQDHHHNHNHNHNHDDTDSDDEDKNNDNDERRDQSRSVSSRALHRQTRVVAGSTIPVTDEEEEEQEQEQEQDIERKKRRKGDDEDLEYGLGQQGIAKDGMGWD